jgi:predicted CXXCH cytochrome family protein
MKKTSLIALFLAAASLFCFTAARAETCVTSSCHGGIASLKYPHAPAKEGDCASCHKPRVKEHPLKGAKSFELTAKGAALCSTCHDAMGKKKYQHQPVKEGDCTSCHKPHGANNRFLLEAGDDRTPLCISCHDAAPFKEKFMHGPAAVGACNSCHAPHESDEKALMKGPVRDVCLQCHADFNAILSSSAFVHPPVAKGPCTACHNPHGSGVAMFLNKKMPDLCIGCHGAIGKKLATVKVPHKPVMEAGGCARCHSAHYSKATRLLSSDEVSVCLSCHGRDDVGKPPLKNIKTQIEGKKYLHGPIAKGSCKACHDPHGSDYFRMLPGPYPAELYVPYQDGIYGACLKCHEKNLLRFQETTLYTGFRNGKRNLHYVHVVNRKGRSCRVCHEPHASDLEKLINKEGMTFGAWKIPLNFKKTPTGGSCEPGCHRPFKYDRVKAQPL